MTRSCSDSLPSCCQIDHNGYPKNRKNHKLHKLNRTTNKLNLLTGQIWLAKSAVVYRPRPTQGISGYCLKRRRSQINAVRLRLVKLKIHSKKRKSIQTNPRIVWVRSCPTSVGGIFQESSESRLEVIFDLIIQVLIYSLLYLRNGGRDNNTTWQLCSVNRVVFTSIARELQW